jgi:hypothetical protein
MMAVDRGFRDVGYLRRDKDFWSLRRGKRWKELVEMIVRLENAKN